MNIRKLASVGLLIATVVVTLTGVFLFLGIGDHKLMVLAHDVFSITFILFVIIHIILNFKLIVGYMAARKELFINIAIAVIFIIVIAKTFSAQPQVSFSDFPPVEQISLRAVLEADGVDYEAALAVLREKGFTVPEGELTIQALTKANRMNPKVIYGTMLLSKEAE